MPFIKQDDIPSTVEKILDQKTAEQRLAIAKKTIDPALENNVLTQADEVVLLQHLTKSMIEQTIQAAVKGEIADPGLLTYCLDVYLHAAKSKFKNSLSLTDASWMIEKAIIELVIAEKPRLLAALLKTLNDQRANILSLGLSSLSQKVPARFVNHSFVHESESVTPLFLAVQNESLSSVLLLLEAGATNIPAVYNVDEPGMEPPPSPLSFALQHSAHCYTALFLLFDFKLSKVEIEQLKLVANDVTKEICALLKKYPQRLLGQARRFLQRIGGILPAAINSDLRSVFVINGNDQGFFASREENLIILRQATDTASLAVANPNSQDEDEEKEQIPDSPGLK